MRNALRLVLALSGASIVGAGALLACSDDTSVNASTEAGVPPGPDGGGLDSPSGDGGADTAPPFDGGFVLDTFDTVLATEICKTLARCCYGTTTPAEGGADGGTFDMAACVALSVQNGFEGSNLGVEIKDAGNVTLDQVSADDCVNKIKALSCNVTGTDHAAAQAACFNAYSGKFTAGQPCKASVECQHGLFCNGQLDGGSGTCAAIRGVGGNCGDNPDHPTLYEETCSYRASGDTGNYCRWHDFGTDMDLDAGEWKCASASDAGAPCETTNWCKNTICDDTSFLCVSPDMLFATSCGRFVH